MRTIVWYRAKDLRVSDHEPLRDAAAGEVIPLFVLDPFFFAPARAQQLPHRMQFVLECLESLAANIAARGSELLFVSGKSTEVVPQLADEWQADRVLAHRWVEPFAQKRDGRIRQQLGDRFQLYEGETLIPPGTLRSGSGGPYRVFTPFARAFRQMANVGRAVTAPKSLPSLPQDLPVERAEIPSCASLGIERNPNLLVGGERAANQRLRGFLSAAAGTYDRDRDRMDLAGTSRLSADLKFGTISVRRVWNAVQERLRDIPSLKVFHNELLWREFSHSTLWDRPELLEEPFRADFVGFPWRHHEEHWQAWTTGETGYPIVDASARQLLGEGFVHNRARMVSASFLTKHLLISYRTGEAHYLKYLTDADWAQNNAGWQWSAGCGCDAQPYFRVFNPVTQGKKFDPHGDYVRRWVPELAELPAKYIHSPWEAPEAVLKQAGVKLGETYPEPVVEHRFARERFLALAAQHLEAGKTKDGTGSRDGIDEVGSQRFSSEKRVRS